MGHGYRRSRADEMIEAGLTRSRDWSKVRDNGVREGSVMTTSEVRLPEVDFAADALPNLHEILDDLRQQGPVSRINFAGRPIWLVNDYETVSQVISHDDVLSAPVAYETIIGPSCGRILPTMTGKHHLLNRAVVSKGICAHLFLSP